MPKKYLVVIDSKYDSFGRESVAPIVFNKILSSMSFFNVNDFEYVFINEQKEQISLKKLKELAHNVFHYIKESGYKFVVVSGADTVKAMIGNRAITKVANTPMKFTEPGFEDVQVIPTFSVYAALRTPEIMDNLPFAFNALQFIQDPTFGAPLPEIIQIDSESKLKDAILYLSEADHVGYDVETSGNGKEGGLKIFDPSFKIITLSLATAKKAFWLNVNYDSNGHPEWVKPLLDVCKNKVVMHNRSFDVLSTKAALGYHDLQGDDTLLYAFLYNENGSHGLKYLAQTRLGWYDYAKDVKETTAETHDFGAVDIKKLGYYNALDSAATINIYHQFIREFEKTEFKKLNDLYRFMMKIQNMFIDATSAGFPIDMEYVVSLCNTMTKERDEMLHTLEQDNDVCRAKMLIFALENNMIDKDAFVKGDPIEEFTLTQEQETAAMNLSFEVSKSRHILALLRAINCVPSDKTAKGMISTAAGTLEKVTHPTMELILKIKQMNTILNTFITGFMDNVYKDGKVHPFFSLTSTVTGRTASQRCNFQNIPRDKRIKNFFKAPEGYKVVQFDFAQAELRIMASFSKDPALTAAICNGADMHKEVASFMFDKPVDTITKEERQAAKSISFGTIYGIGPAKLAEEIGDTEQAARNKLDLFMAKFKGVAEWIKSTHVQARRDGYISSPFGRKRRLPTVWVEDMGVRSGALRQAVNAPIQSTASDLALLLIYWITSHMNTSLSTFVGSVHDSGVFIVHDSYVDDFVKVIQNGIHLMNTKGTTFLTVPMKCDISVGQRWGEVADYEVKEV